MRSNTSRPAGAKKLTLAAAVSACLLMGGCATPYTDARNALTGITGGYTEREGPGQLTKVEFFGNGYIDNAKVEQYLMHRCAELTRSRGKQYFVAYDSLVSAIRNRSSNRISIGRFGGKPVAYVFITMSDEMENMYAVDVGKYFETHELTPSGVVAR